VPAVFRNSRPSKAGTATDRQRLSSSADREAFEDFGHKNKRRNDQRGEVLANHPGKGLASFAGHHESLITGK